MGFQRFRSRPRPPPPPPPPSISIRDLNAGSSESPKDMRIFALLIGINYLGIKNIKNSESYHPLCGGVADAHSVREYLENCLGVPSNQITSLIDKKATRLAIINAFSDLRTDDRIRKGDAILIYYSGHGGKEDQMGIIPYDAVIPDQLNVQPIHDFVLEILLARIANQKGNNITVIFDCSNSAPGSTPSGFNRACIVDVPSREDEITAEEARFLHTAESSGSTSHVLLTSCGPKQLARERKDKNGVGHGVFTDALLKLLQQVAPYNLRHADIVGRLTIRLAVDGKGQDPQCAGLYRNRVLFNREAFKSKFLVRYDKTANHGSGGFYVHAGATHNLTLGSKIAIYRESDFNLTQQLGVLLVNKLYPFFITAKLAAGHLINFKVDQSMVAIAEEERIYLRIHISPNDDTLRASCDVEKYKPMYQLYGVRVVDEIQDSHVEIASKDIEIGIVTVCITIRTVTHDKFNHIISVGRDHRFLPWLLSRMAHFYRELEPPDIFADSNANQFYANIKVEFYQLKEVVSIISQDTGLLDVKLDAMGQNLYVDGMVNLIVADQDGYSIPYGLKLYNNSDQDFHVNVFHFTNSDLSISSCAESDPSNLLLPQSNLTVGYGRKEDSPICFEISDLDKYHIDVGFLKIYLSTQPVNLRLLPQPSPFTSTPWLSDYYTAIPKVSWIEIVIPIKQNHNVNVNI